LENVPPAALVASLNKTTCLKLFTFTNESERLGTSVQQLSCTVSQVPCSHGKPMMSGLGVASLMIAPKTPSVVAIHTPCG
jgi:hypothetical protein